MSVRLIFFFFFLSQSEDFLANLFLLCFFFWKTKFQTAETDNKYYCEYCGRPFSTSSHKQRHETLHCRWNPYSKRANTPRGEFICQKCDFDFKYIQDLTEHKKFDCGRLHECRYCGKVYDRLKILRAHYKKFHPPFVQQMTK